MNLTWQNTIDIWDQSSWSKMGNTPFWERRVGTSTAYRQFLRKSRIFPSCFLCWRRKQVWNCNIYEVSVHLYLSVYLMFTMETVKYSIKFTIKRWDCQQITFYKILVIITRLIMDVENSVKVFGPLNPSSF